MKQLRIRIKDHILHNETEFQAKKIRQFLSGSGKRIVVFKHKIWIDDKELRSGMGFAKTAKDNFIEIRRFKTSFEAVL